MRVRSRMSVVVHPQQPAGGVPQQQLDHRMIERSRRVAGREITEAALARLVPPAGGGLLIVARHRAQQQMLLVQIVFRHVLLVEDLEILYAASDGMLLVLDANSEGPGL